MIWPPLARIRLIFSGIRFIFRRTLRILLNIPYFHFQVRPPPLMINFEGINPFSDSFLHRFYVTDPAVEVVNVRDIYKLEFDLFQSGFWTLYYCFSVFVFLAHYCWGWQKV